MNKISSNTVLCKIKAFFEELSKIQLKSDYHVKLSLFRDETAQQHSCTQSITGSSKCRIIKIFAAASIVLLVTSLLHDIYYCSRFKK